ncbi:Fc.00g086290.m01.CDS01 [Cosmosporella sp. VM-42]
MTDSSLSARPSSHRSSSALEPASRLSDSSSIRPRNRRLVSTLGDEGDNSPPPSNRTSGLLSALSASNSRTASPRRSGVSPNRAAGAANLGSFLNDSWTQSWASVQGLASSLISGDDGQGRASRSQSSNRAGSRPGTWGRDYSSSSTSRKGLGAWGPAPPSKPPGLDDVAAGSLADREAALKAARKASVLESHDGVNGGLDITGKHKRRNSDEVIVEQPEVEDYLVYVHKVQLNDTYAGLILRYQCREDAFRKANGLWSRDSVQMRKWLTIPVDACEIKGRPCEAPSWHNPQGVDLLAPTPAIEDEPNVSQAVHDDFFSRPANGSTGLKSVDEDDNPWTHVRWVKMDSFQEPIEIARVARKAMGYFPPRRKKSIRTISTFSTPRQSLDMASNPPGSLTTPSSRRQSVLGSRPQLSETAMSSPSRGLSSDGLDGRPSWMRRPGGVGSMGRNVRAPGPDKDVFNSWAKKHLPALNIEGLPSMSIMGSETARFGFKPDEPAGIADNYFVEGQEANLTAQQGNGLDKAAAAVETWLRGAIARHQSASFSGSRGRSEEGDLIELTDTASDDGRTPGSPPTRLLNSLSLGSSGRSDGDGTVRGRTMASGSKGGKAD